MERFKEISMSGRMAYVIMCVERFLVEKYPERDWTIVSEALWKATEMNWSDWTDLYAFYIPHVLFSYEEYGSDLSETITEETYNTLNTLYTGITDGSEDDPQDRLDYMLNKPHEMAMVYEGTGVGDGHESYEIIEETEKILHEEMIPLPAYEKVKGFSYGSNGWGEAFDGRYLSIILTTV